MSDHLSTAKRVFQIESAAVAKLADRLGENFNKAVDLIFNCKGKVIVTGMGKSGIVGRKISSTLSSTGTPAFFLHPAEGIHGDVGMVSRNDVVIAISYSGETEELLCVVPVVKRLGTALIAITGRLTSTLANMADLVLDVAVEEEACPLGLAPTASTTATLAMGDALAVALLLARNLTEEQFARLHPGGSLGRKLLLTVENLMHGGEGVPRVHVNTLMRDVIVEMTSKRLGATTVEDESGKLVGIITDGDLRRALTRHGDSLLSKPASEVMTSAPKVIVKNELAITALRMMEENRITQLFVVDSKTSDSVIGVLHFHDLLDAGLV